MIIPTTKQMRPRAEHDFYPTPEPVVHAALTRYAPYFYTPPFILDPGAGDGVFGKVARRQYPDAYIVGTDIRPLSRPPHYDYWQTGGYDFLLNTESDVFDLVIGNPPYKFAEAFVRRGMALLRPGGTMLLLLRLAFLGSQGRARGLWGTYPPHEVIVCAQRPSFTGNSKTDSDVYAFYLWRKSEWHSTPRLSWMDWKADEVPA